MKTNKKTCEVAIHFNRTPHVLSDFAFQCIDQIQTDTSENTDKLLITKESYWSAQLFSLSPFGLNKRQEFHSKNRIIILNSRGLRTIRCDLLEYGYCSIFIFYIFFIVVASAFRGPLWGFCYFHDGWVIQRLLVGGLLLIV